MKSKTLLIVLSILFCTKLYAQQNRIDNHVALLTEADNSALHDNYTDAIAKYNEILSILKKEEETYYKPLLINRLAQIYRKQGDFKTAIEYAENGLKMSRNIDSKNPLQEAIALDILGRVNMHNSTYEKSLDYHTRALEIKKTIAKIDSSEIALSYFHIAKVKQFTSKFDEALGFLNKALTIKLEPTPKNNIVISNIYQILGRINYDLGFKDDALHNLLKSQKYALKELPADNSYFDQLYNEIGIVYADKGNNYEAITYLQKALSLNIKKSGENINPDKVAIHFNMGTAYANLGIKDKALFHTQKTIDMGKMAFGEDHINFHFAYSQLGRIHGGEKGVFYINKAIELLNRNPHKRHQILVSFYHMFLADIYAETKDYDKAQQEIGKTLEIRSNIHGDNNFRTIKAINRLSKNYLMQEHLDQALMVVNRSINANYIDYDIKSKTNHEFDISKMQDPQLFIEAIQIKTAINMSKYRDSKNPEFLKTSYQLSRSLDQVIRKTRNALRDQNDKLFFTSLVKTIYEKHIEICMLLNELELDDSYKHEAFEFSEKSKSNILRELVSSNKIKDEINIDNDIIVLEKQIVNALAEARTLMVTEVSKPETDTMRVYAHQEKIVDLFHKKDSLEQAIELNYPKYFKLKYDKPVITVSNLQSQLDENTTLVEFLIAEEFIFTFIVNKDSYHIKTLKVDNLDQKIEALNKGVVNQEQHTYEENARILYRELFKPLETLIKSKNVVIVPDETLWHLQFDLLINEEKPATSNYLLYDYAFSYANSATFLNETLNNNSGITEECLAFSFTGQEENSNNEVLDLRRLRNSAVDLPGTRQEIKALSNIFDGSYFYGKNANEHNFKTNVSNYKITHLALHAEIDSLNPENLRILFSEFNKNPTLEDNILFGHELYTLSIPSDLVVLSACNTGVGKINKGEGIMSIGNAFQYAGAKSLLLSRWEISDETTPVIIEQFYKNLKGGMTKSMALRQAKLNFIDNASLLQSQPFYWGSFYILGNDTPIQLDKNNNYFIIVTVTALTLLLLFFLQKKKKAR